MTDVEKDWPEWETYDLEDFQFIPVYRKQYNEARDAILKVKDLEAEVERLTKLACDRLVHKDLLTEYAKRAIELEEKNRKLFLQLCGELPPPRFYDRAQEVLKKLEKLKS